MTAPAGTTALAPGVRVRPWRHHLAAWDLSARVALHTGVEHVDGRLQPVGAPRPATPDELALLDGLREPDVPALEVFTSPARLRRQFWALDPDALPDAGADAPPSPAWGDFAREVHAFLEVAHVRLPAQHALVLTVRDPAAAPGLWAEGPGYALLHACFPAARTAAEAPRAVWLNVGDGPASLAFYNLPLGAMADLLGDAVPPRAQPREVLRAFAATFPRCPLVRLTLQPGDGALIPVLGLAVDVGARDADDLVVSVVVLPGPGPAATE